MMIKQVENNKENPNFTANKPQQFENFREFECKNNETSPSLIHSFLKDIT